MAVELYGDAPVSLNGVDLMAKSYRELVAYLRGEGVSLVEQRDGFRCDALGVAAYAPQLGDPDAPEAQIESMLVYARGYYDDLDAKRTDESGRS